MRHEILHIGEVRAANADTPVVSRTVSDDGVARIAEFESLLVRLPDGRYQSYLCPAGVWTIYAGVTHGVAEGAVWTEAECRSAFARELDEIVSAINQMLRVPVSQGQFDALVSLAYNIGWPALKKSTLMSRLNSGDYVGASARFNDFRKARVKGKVARDMGVADGTLVTLPGLVRRRAVEAAMFLDDTDDQEGRPDGMPQSVAETPVQWTGAGVGKAVTTAAATGAVVLEGAKAVAPSIPAPPSLEDTSRTLSTGLSIAKQAKEVRSLVGDYPGLLILAAGVLAVLGLHFVKWRKQ
ncbi:MAG: lysozyme [Alsobacter sp.]